MYYIKVAARQLSKRFAQRKLQMAKFSSVGIKMQSHSYIQRCNPSINQHTAATFVCVVLIQAVASTHIVQHCGASDKA